MTRALVGTLVASPVAAGGQRVCPDADGGRFGACNTEGRAAAMKPGTTTPPTKDYVRVASARTDSAAAWTTWIGPIRMESAEP